MLKGVRCVRGTAIPMEEHLRCQREEIGPPCGIPQTVLNMILAPDTEREKEGVVYSYSSINGCHRRTVLSSKHDYFINIAAEYKRTRGSIFHNGISQEPAPPGTLGVVRELRMLAPINTKFGTVDFKGKPDEVVLLRVEEYVQVDGTLPVKHRLHVKITDIKTTSEIGHDLIAAGKTHVEQVNAYAWLVKRFLPAWISKQAALWAGGWEVEGMDLEHLYLNRGVVLPQIDEVVVDELSIVYIAMDKPRTFTSLGFLEARGKMKGEMRDGHWRRDVPNAWETLELEPVHEFGTKFTESLIRKGIESQIEAETMLAPPLTGDKARLMCGSCPVKQQCCEIGAAEGRDMTEQRCIDEQK